MATTIYTVQVDEAMEHEVACPTLEAAQSLRKNCYFPDGTITKLAVADCRCGSSSALSSTARLRRPTGRGHGCCP
jgi:hypothetical protein